MPEKKVPKKKASKIVLDEHYILPQAAVEKMKAARNTKQTVYIYGITGTGKTSFVTSFFARKPYYYPGREKSVWGEGR